jgi:hypothetical protein
MDSQAVTVSRKVATNSNQAGMVSRAGINSQVEIMASSNMDSRAGINSHLERQGPPLPLLV